jgi:hypothetical protein
MLPTVPRCRCRPGPLTYVAGIIRRQRAAAGSRWRKLNPTSQAGRPCSCWYPRKGETFAELTDGFGVGTNDGVAVCQRDRLAAGGAGAEAPQGGPGREEVTFTLATVTLSGANTARRQFRFVPSESRRKPGTAGSRALEPQISRQLRRAL